MQEIRSSNPPVVTGICDPNKSRVRHHRSLKLGSKLKYLSILYLVKQKELYPYEYISDFEKFKEELPSKEKFYSSLTHRKASGKEFEHVLNIWKKLR